MDQVGNLIGQVNGLNLSGSVGSGSTTGVSLLSQNSKIGNTPAEIPTLGTVLSTGTGVGGLIPQPIVAVTDDADADDADDDDNDENN